MTDNRPQHAAGRRPSLFWRIVIVFAAATLVWRFIYHVGNAFFGPDYDPVRHAVAAVLTSALAVPVVLLACRFLDRREWDGLRLTSLRAGLRPLLIGMACWLIPAGIGVAACVAFGWVGIIWTASVGETVRAAAGLMVLVFLYEALPEEVIFRGYFYRNLTTAMPQWPAILVQAALFTLFGIAVGAAGSFDRVVLFFFFSVVLGVFRSITGNVWAPIGFHLAFQTVAQLFGPAHDQIAADPLYTLQAVAFGTLPFALGWIALETIIYRKSPSWKHGERDLPA